MANKKSSIGNIYDKHFSEGSKAAKSQDKKKATRAKVIKAIAEKKAAKTTPKETIKPIPAVAMVREPKADSVVAMRKMVKGMGVKYHGIFSKAELQEIIAGADQARITELQAQAIVRWKEGWGKEKAPKAQEANTETLVA